MKRIKHSEAEIIRILKKQEQGMNVSEIYREHGISEATFFQSLSAGQQRQQQCKQQQPEALQAECYNQ